MTNSEPRRRQYHPGNGNNNKMRTVFNIALADSVITIWNTIKATVDRGVQNILIKYGHMSVSP